MYEIKAFKFQNEDQIYDALSGHELTNYAGLVMVYPVGNLSNRSPVREAIFKTWLEHGERAWKCLHVFGGHTLVEYRFV